LIHRAHTVCFCTLVTILDTPRIFNLLGFFKYIILESSMHPK
jgi:hypothetical protein